MKKSKMNSLLIPHHEELDKIVECQKAHKQYLFEVGEILAKLREKTHPMSEETSSHYNKFFDSLVNDADERQKSFVTKRRFLCTKVAKELIDIISDKKIQVLFHSLNCFNLEKSNFFDKQTGALTHLLSKSLHTGYGEEISFQPDYVFVGIADIDKIMKQYSIEGDNKTFMNEVIKITNKSWKGYGELKFLFENSQHGILCKIFFMPA